MKTRYLIQREDHGINGMPIYVWAAYRKVGEPSPWKVLFRCRTWREAMWMVSRELRIDGMAEQI